MVIRDPTQSPPPPPPLPNHNQAGKVRAMLYGYLELQEHHRQAAYLESLLLFECPVGHGERPVDIDAAFNYAKDLMRPVPSAASRMIEYADTCCGNQLGVRGEQKANIMRVIYPNIVRSVHLGQRVTILPRMDDYFVYFLTTDCKGRLDPTNNHDMRAALQQWKSGVIDQKRAAEIIAGFFENQCDPLPLAPPEPRLPLQSKELKDRTRPKL